MMMDIDNLLKHRLWLLMGIAACLTTACQQQENEEISDRFITFSPTLDNELIGAASTRVEDIDLKSFGFTVCGYESVEGRFDEKLASTYPNVFKDKSVETGKHFQRVTYDAGKFITKERPWVVAATNYLTFFAWSDNAAVANKTENGITGHSDANKAGYPTISIALDDDPLKQPDIVVAHAIDLRNNALISAVDMQFSHLLSKISFKGYSSSATSVQINKFTIQYGGVTSRKGTFDFNPTNDQPFGLTTTTHGSTAEYSIIPTGQAIPGVDGTQHTSPATGVLLGNMMQIPQDAPDDFITINVTYQIKGYGEIVGPAITRKIPIKAMKLQRGRHYQLAFDFVSSEVMVSINSIANWNEMGASRLPLVAGPKGNVLLWLDAGDAPYNFNGERYWLDRSGYNRHCKFSNTISGGTVMTYDKAAKVYQFDSQTSKPGVASNYFILPDLGSQKEITVQLLLKMYPAGNTKAFSTPFFYSSTNIEPSPSDYNLGVRQLFFNIYEPSNNALSINFDWAKTPSSETTGWERMSIQGLTKTQANEFALLTFRRKTGYKSIARNLSHNVENPGMNTDDKAAMLTHGLLGAHFDGEIKTVKIYNFPIGNAQVESDYEYVKRLHKLPDEKIDPLGNLPTYKADLIAYFDALDPPKIYSASNVPVDVVQWRDRTGNGNHLQIYGYKKSGTSGITYDATNKCYVFHGDSKESYMKIIKTLGEMKAYSVELFVSNDGIGEKTQRVLLHFTSQDNTASSNNGIIWHFPDASERLWAYANGQVCVFDDGASSKDWTYTWGIGRGLSHYFENRANFYAGRGSNHTAWAEIGQNAPKLVHCYIGMDANKSMPFKGKIKRIRIYKRTITPQERLNMINEMKTGIN